MPEIIEPEHHREIIESGKVITRNEVEGVDLVKVKASLKIAYTALAIASTVLIVSMFTHEADLRSWATGLISSIAGAALTYGFTTRHKDK